MSKKEKRISSKIIAVDFDGTLCENAWPGIGKPKKEVIEYLKKEQAKGAKLILWTCRTGKLSVDAYVWCKKQGLIMDEVNANISEAIDIFGGDTRKVFAHEYIDDRMSNLFSFAAPPQKKLQQAEKVLVQNGVADLDEAAEVLQAIGYILYDMNLYPEEREA